MTNLVFFGNFDSAELIVTTFVLFFIGLVIYLRREDRREGYPLEDDVTGRLEAAGDLLVRAAPKQFILPHDEGVLTVPNNDRESRQIPARRSSPVAGSPLYPVGDPMGQGIGPGAFAQRARRPDRMLSGADKIAPMRLSPDFFIDRADADPRGMTVYGVDGVSAGVVSDLWIDRSEFLIRYLEVTIGPERNVLLPMTMADVDGRRKAVKVHAILGSQFGGVPPLENPDRVTMDEEERVCAYYGGGLLYATPGRSEPYL